jgi:hypothetical protein
MIQHIGVMIAILIPHVFFQVPQLSRPSTRDLPDDCMCTSVHCQIFCSRHASSQKMPAELPPIRACCFLARELPVGFETNYGQPYALDFWRIQLGTVPRVAPDHLIQKLHRPLWKIFCNLTRIRKTRILWNRACDNHCWVILKEWPISEKIRTCHCAREHE